MEHIINVTHELEARDVRYYSIEKVMSSHMFDDFIKVENVSIILKSLSTLTAPNSIISFINFRSDLLYEPFHSKSSII